jgi:hypothetical protein
MERRRSCALRNFRYSLSNQPKDNHIIMKTSKVPSVSHRRVLMFAVLSLSLVFYGKWAPLSADCKTSYPNSDPGGFVEACGECPDCPGMCQMEDTAYYTTCEGSEPTGYWDCTEPTPVTKDIATCGCRCVDNFACTCTNNWGIPITLNSAAWDSSATGDPCPEGGEEDPPDE